MLVVMKPETFNNHLERPASPAAGLPGMDSSQQSNLNKHAYRSPRLGAMERAAVMECLSKAAERGNQDARAMLERLKRLP